jgi:hypothetical protein
VANFARIDSTTNEVLEIAVVNNEDVNDLEFPESEVVGVEFLAPWNKDGTYWRQTSFSSSFRKMYAMVGGFYHPEGDFFYEAQPHASWTLSVEAQEWVPPHAKPEDSYNAEGMPTTYYVWREDEYNQDNTKGWVDAYTIDFGD